MKAGVKRPNWYKSWRLTPRKVSTCESFNAQPKHTPSGPRKWIFTLNTLAYSFSVILGHQFTIKTTFSDSSCTSWHFTRFILYLLWHEFLNPMVGGEELCCSSWINTITIVFHSITLASILRYSFALQPDECDDLWHSSSFSPMNACLTTTSVLP